MSKSEAQLGVGAGGELPLPWLADPLQRARGLSRVHALLVHGPSGAGHLELAVLLAQMWLCEDTDAAPCGRCTSCRLIKTRAHPDLLLVVPEALRERLGWSSGDEGATGKAEAKPSREIRIQQVRQAIVWSQTSTGRGRGKVLVIHPADALNPTAANALLKTLEEPPGTMRLVLTSADPERLLPTVRSRCQRLLLALPTAPVAQAWLTKQNVPEPEGLLALAAGSPIDALGLAEQGVDARWRVDLPGRVAAGDASQLQGRPTPMVIELLAKLAHDAMAVAAGSAPRYYPAGSVPAARNLPEWSAWLDKLLDVSRNVDHAWNAPLLVEALVSQASQLWPADSPRTTRGGAASLHSTR